jgi:hypothetical protein
MFDTEYIVGVQCLVHEYNSFLFEEHASRGSVTTYLDLI